MHNQTAKLISWSQVSPDSPFHLKVKSVSDLIVYCARVSNLKSREKHDSPEKLLNYLITNKHWSPFEMVSCCIEIKTTRDIARQLLRHRSFSFQEFSQRYASPTNDYLSDDFVVREARLQDNQNRQNSISVEDADLHKVWADKQEAVLDIALEAYDWAISCGIAKEVARSVLPEGLTPSTLYVNGTIRSWIHYIEVRSANGTQKEHIELAQECAKAIANIFPIGQ